MSAATLSAFLTKLRAAPTTTRPPNENWSAMIARTSQHGTACVIDEETYGYFLNVLPPKYLGNGFAFAEGAEPLRYFWHVRPDQFFCRQLTWGETTEFCHLANIALPI